jgi:hypothetical protein
LLKKFRGEERFPWFSLFFLFGSSPAPLPGDRREREKREQTEDAPGNEGRKGWRVGDECSLFLVSRFSSLVVGREKSRVAGREEKGGMEWKQGQARQAGRYIYI